jgi:Casein kinase substrate phosphoprotein PP28
MSYREEKEKREAKERYWKLHLQGKTTEAQTDLARLAKVRAEREAAAAKRKAEEECMSLCFSTLLKPHLTVSTARAAEAEAKRQQQMAKQRK